MSNVSIPDIQSQVMSAAEPQIMQAIREQADILKDYIRYEYTMSNMELASSWQKHGFDFKMMPESFIEHIRITPVSTGGNRYSLEVVVDAESFREEQTSSKYDFFKKYVISNAMTKMKSRLGSR